jgi:hypothetical protein
MEPVAHLTGLGRVDQDGGGAGPAVAQAAEEVGGLQLHRDPLRPGTVDAGVADEESLALGSRPPPPPPCPLDDAQPSAPAALALRNGSSGRDASLPACCPLAVGAPGERLGALELGLELVDGGRHGRVHVKGAVQLHGTRHPPADVVEDPHGDLCRAQLGDDLSGELGVPPRGLLPWQSAPSTPSSVPTGTDPWPRLLGAKGISLKTKTSWVGPWAPAPLAWRAKSPPSRATARAAPITLIRRMLLPSLAQVWPCSPRGARKFTTKVADHVCEPYRANSACSPAARTVSISAVAASASGSGPRPPWRSAPRTGRSRSSRLRTRSGPPAAAPRSASWPARCSAGPGPSRSSTARVCRSWSSRRPRPA